MSLPLPETGKGPFSEPGCLTYSGCLLTTFCMNDLFSLFAPHRSIWTYSTVWLSVQLPYIYLKLPSAVVPD